MPERLRVLAGDCTVTDCGDRTRTYRGHVVVLVKPDNTTLVHDADGYQPVAWLTRPEDVVVEVFDGTPKHGTHRDRSGDSTGGGDGDHNGDEQWTETDRKGAAYREGSNDRHDDAIADGHDRLNEHDITRDTPDNGHLISSIASAKRTAPHNECTESGTEDIDLTSDCSKPSNALTKPDNPQGRIVDTDTPQTGFRVTARDGSRQLTVVSTSVTAHRELPVTDAGIPVGTCPEDGGALVRTGGDVVCLDCTNRWGLPTGASVTDTTCETCGLPKFRVERGEPFHLCLDPSCDPLTVAVRDRFDREWHCPDCAGDLRVRSAPGRVYLACEHDDTCGRTVSFPHGVLIGECACGQPVFETGSGRRCLDRNCDRTGETR